MLHLQQVRVQSEHPEKPESGAVFRELLKALEEGGTFEMAHLDKLSYREFETAVESIREWRSLRYIASDDPVYTFPLHD